MSRILRFFALVAVVFFSVNAFAGDPYGSCSAKKVYTDCADEGYVVQNGECVPESSGSCSAGQYWNGSACTSCPDSHPHSEAGASSESECYKLAELMKNGGSGTCFGKTGTLDGTITCYYGSSCALPSWNSSTCNMTNGSKIFQGWSSSDDATTGTTEDFENGQIYYAVWVTPDCNITNGSGVATTASSNKPRCNVTCNSGYGTSGTYTGSAGATSVSYTCTITSNTCSAGQYWNGSACKECTSGYYCPGGTWTGTGVQGRESCPAGYGNSEPGSVDESDCYLTTTAGKYVATPESAETTCAENGYCPGGIVVPYGDTDGRMACTANSSSGAGSDDISDCKCNAGYGGNAGVTNGTCTICAAGTYKTSSGNSSCSTCTAGSYCTGGTNRTACTANSTSPAGADAINDCQCNAGYGGNAGVTNGTCTICAAGTYKTSSGNSSCSTCTEGYYCTGGTNQTTCPTGYGDSAPGSDAQSDCYMVVDAGYYLPDEGSTSPIACPRGSSSGQHEVYYGSVSQCSGCAPGSYTPYEGAACSVCPAGSYCTGDGNATRCPALYPNSSAGSDAATDCYTNTLTGQYIATPRAEAVTDCQAGTSAGAHTVYYGETSQCNVCKANQWSGDAAGSCQTCPSGWTNDGETAADHAYISSCKHTVAAGSWYNSDNSTFDTCATGTYSAEHLAGYGVSTSCESCNTGYTNNTDHTACVGVTYTVKYNANGATGGATASSSHTYGVAKALTANGFTRTGYTFAGWATSASGDVVYTNQQSVANLTSTQGATVNLYAKWTANTYTVQYNANGGTGGTTASSSHTYGVAKALTANGFTRTGYTFAGWATSASGDVVYTNQQSVTNLTSTQGATVNLYAKWTAGNYSIFLDPSPYYTGGTSYLYTTYDTNVYLDSNRSQAMTTNANPITKPTQLGYTFAGYYSGSGGTGTEYIDANGYITSAGLSAAKECASTIATDCKWYAKWTQDCYKITLDNTTNGGSGGTTVLYTTYNSGKRYSDSSCSTRVTTITKPAKTNASYAGHYTIASGSGDQYILSSGSLSTRIVSGPITLYARYDCDTNWRGSGTNISGACTGTQSTVSFDANGGTGGQTDDVTATYGSAMPTISTTAPTRTGYTFNGWYDAQTGGTQYYYSTGASARTWDKTATTTLYARWTANTYTVSFNVNGGTGGQTDDVTATYGHSMPTINRTKPTRTGYTFSGWYDAQTGGTQYYTAAGLSARSWNKTENTTLYAQWTVNTYTCSSGQYLNVSYCATCTAGYYCPSSSVTYTYNGSVQGRTECGGNTKYSSSGATACSIVSSGYYSTGGTSTTRTGQTKCEAGNYCYGGVKTACGAGKYSSAGATSCSNITAGCYGTSASSSCPAVCAANTYSDAGASACTSCDSDYANSGTDATSHAGVASCKVTCAAGTYVASANAACTDVGSGYYTTASQTISQGSTGSRSACSSLNAFYTASDSGRNATTDCYGTTSSGKYVSTAKSGEVTCAAGGYCAGSVKVYYNSTGGRTGCGAGKYNASTGSSASSACTNITAGCYGTSASSSCPAVCAANTYSNAGASSCSSCPTDYKNSGDTAASHAGSASCKITVSGGYYIGTSGDNSSNWDKCACGTYKASHTVAYGSTSSCATTDAGYYAAAGASSQTKATAGYYAAAGACSQTACSGRTKYSAAGAESCSTVSTGYYTTGCNSSSNACTSQTICAKGTYCSSGVAYNCPGGTYGSTTGLSTNACSGKCTAGYYCPAGSTSATQNACATNATSAAGSDAISDCVCKAGYSGDASTSSGTCTACACGYYKGSTGNTSCTKTTAGYYAAGTGNTGQTKATAGNYAAAGACSQSSCADLGGGLYSSSAAGSDAASDCYATVPATKYLSSSTSTSFTTCTAGYYCPGKTLYYASTGGRTGCGGGKYSEEGSDDASSDCKSISAGCYGASAASACPNTCAPGSYSTGGASGCTICGNKPTNSSYTDARGNTSADCPWTCNDGYNQTSDNQCGQFCTAGITHIKSSNGLSVPLYSSARTSPAINVKVNDSVCYGSLATGQSSGALNVRVGSTTYHSIN